MGSPNADDERAIADKLAHARLQSEKFWGRHRKICDAVREIESRAADQVMALEDEQDLTLDMTIAWNKRADALDLELSRARELSRLKSQ